MSGSRELCVGAGPHEILRANEKQNTRNEPQETSASNRDNAKLSREIENVIVAAAEWRYAELGNQPRYLDGENVQRVNMIRLKFECFSFVAKNDAIVQIVRDGRNICP